MRTLWKNGAWRKKSKKEILLDCIVHDLSGPLATILMNLQHVSRQMERQDLREGVGEGDRAGGAPAGIDPLHWGGFRP
ncbi:MAG: hypothetical protein R3F31_15125 [Verrucomicrobiales bacterium]